MNQLPQLSIRDLIPTQVLSFFTDECPGMTIGHLDIITNKLQKEIRSDYVNVEDKIRALNMQTFIYFQCHLYHSKKANSAQNKENINKSESLNTNNEERLINNESLYKAIECSDQVFQLSSWNNMMSIVYRYHLFIEIDDKDKAGLVLTKLRDLKKDSGYELMLAEVMSEMAYTCSRLRDYDNLLKATDLYKQAISKSPDNYVWKYGLGLAQSHIVCLFSTSLQMNVGDTNKLMLSAVIHLFDIAEKSGDSELCSQSYCQLAIINRFLINEDLLTDELSLQYKKENVKSLVDKALQLEPNNAKTLRDCGRLLTYDTDKAIQVLEKSVSILEHSTTVHSLGIVYKNKAINEAKSISAYRQMENKTQHMNKKRNFPISCPAVCINLDIGNEYVQKAIGYHKKSIDLESGHNYPAMYTLGLLLRSCGCTDKAMDLFRSIIQASSTSNECSGSTNHHQRVNLDTQVAAYLQLGLCALDKSKPTEDDFNYCREQMICAIEAIHSVQNAASEMNDLKRLVKRTVEDLKTSDQEKYFCQNGLWKILNSIFKAFRCYKVSARK